MKRRTFLKAAGSAAGAYALGMPSLITAAEANAPKPADTSTPLPRRVLGRTGVSVSIIGFPGLALIRATQTQCTEALHQAFDASVNYFDVAPAYGNGDAETKMGIGLQGLDRQKIFLACKTKNRDKTGAREELERSLKLLKTDYLDLYQLHYLRTPDEVKHALGPNGTMETFLKAKAEGKVKYLGFSAHTTKGALEIMKGFSFDTVMFPINFVEFFNFGFGKPILELARQQGAAVLAIKPMCRGAWPKDVLRTRDNWYRPLEDPQEIELALRFTLAQKGVVAGIPPAFIDLFEQAVAVAKRWRPLSETEIEQLKTIATTCESLFQREEKQVAMGGTWRCPIYPDSPHESGGEHA
jgi:aryl-alcohol dehydrogenase-like predicted oxidoreductase